MKRLRYLWRAFNYRWRVTPDEIAFLAGAVAAGDTAVDVGCHKGGFLYWLRRYVGASGRVYGFEPQPALAQYLKDVVALQGWSNVVIEAAGASSSEGAMELFVPGNAGRPSPGATLSPANPDEPHHSVRVPVVTLDGYFGRRGERRIGCIKLDCEGHEMEAFKGAAGLLRRDRPALLFECEQRHLRGVPLQSVFDYLRGFGYRGRFFGPAGLMPIEEFRPEIHQAQREGRYWDADDYCNNFAFLPET